MTTRRGVLLAKPIASIHHQFASPHGVPMARPCNVAVLRFASSFAISIALLSLLGLVAFMSPSAFGQRIKLKSFQNSVGESDKDDPQQRAQWNMRGREAPKGESAAALRLRAHQQKLSMRAYRATQYRVTGVKLPQTTSWVSFGPAPLASDAGNGQDYNWVSGRATSVVIDPADLTGNTVLLGGAYGGLWKSTNAGSQSADPSLVTWQALIDDQPSLAVGAIALQPGNSNVIVVGTGETNSSGDSYYGMGILRSTDGGNTWTQVTHDAPNTHSFVGVGFSKIAFSTSNPDLVLASTAGDIGFDFGLEQDGNSTARGLYYSSDAGASWNRVTLSDNAVASSVTGVVFNPSQGANGTFYAAIRRHGIYSSTDGQHFTRLSTQPTSGLASANCPAGSNSSNCLIYRAEFAVTPGRNEMYVWIMHVSSSGNEIDDGIWQTNNGGSTWTHILDNGITNCGDGGGCGMQQGVYNLEIAAVPDGSSTGHTDLYAGTINIYKCTLTGGSTCSQGDWINLTHVYGCSFGGDLAHVHPDQHGLAFMVVGTQSPGYFAHDGGISRTLDGYTGLTTGNCAGHNQFDSLSQTLGSMTEFVSFSVHPTDAGILLGGTQDNGSPKTLTAGTSTTWQNALSGDGGYNIINPNFADQWFASLPFSQIGICQSGTSCDDNSFFLLAAPGFNIDQGAFYTPFILDPQSTGEMLIGTCRMWRGSTGFATFNKISKIFDNGGTGLCTGGEINQVAGIDVGGPTDKNGLSNVLYATTWGYGPFAGLGGGEVWSTTNAAGASMNNVTGAINPNHYAISSVAIDNSVADGQTAYVGIMGFHVEHVFKTTNAGGTWTDWTGSGNTALPDAPVTALLVDGAAALVYAGTDVGVFVSSTTSASWTEVGPVAGPGVNGFLPSAPVTALRMFNPNPSTKRLRVSTYGRGIWEFNVAEPDFTNFVSNSPQWIFPSQTATFNGTLTSQNGYNSLVNLSCTGNVPATCTLNPTQVLPVDGGAHYTLSASGALGDYSFNSHAVGTDPNNLTHDAALILHVVDFGLTAPNPGSITVPDGFTAQTTFQVTASGSFQQIVNLSCPNGLPTGATCSFAPPGPSPRSGNPVTVTLTVAAAGNTPTGTYSVTIEGDTVNPTGSRTTTFQLTVQPAPDFTWSIPPGDPTSHTVLAGQTSLQYTFHATPSGSSTFTGPVTFSCGFAPTDPTLSNSNCTFVPASIAAGAGATDVTMTIATAGPNNGTPPAMPQLRRHAASRSGPPLLPLVLPMVGILFAALAGRKTSKYSAIGALLVSLVLLGLLIACGGGGNSSTPPPPPPVSVTINPSTAVNLFANEPNNQWPAPQAQQYTATVHNSGNSALTWSLIQNGTDCTDSGICGTLSATTGSPVTYTAPSAIPNPANLTVKATAQADGSKSASAAVNLLQPTVNTTFNITVTATEGSVSHSISPSPTLIVE